MIYNIIFIMLYISIQFYTLVLIGVEHSSNKKQKLRKQKSNSFFI